MKSLIIALVMTLSAPAMAKVTVGTVDIQRILITIKEGKAVRAKLETAFKKKQKILKSSELGFKKKTEDFQKQRLVLNEKKRVEKEKALQKELYDLEQKRGKFQKEIQDMEARLKKPILEKVRAIIKTVSEKSGVEMTFEVSTAPIVYAKNQKDLSADVIKAYDKKFK